MNETMSNEDRLRAEIDDLRRQLEEHKKQTTAPAGPSRTTLAGPGIR